MKTIFEALPPIMPNFIRVKGQPQIAIPIESLTEEEAKAYAEFMAKTFIEHYNKKRNG